jgi:hypothetical protein
MNMHDDSELITGSVFLSRMWAARLYILGSTALFAFLALAFAFLMPQKYTVSMLISPVTPVETPGTTAGSLASTFLGKQTDPKFELFQTIIKTEGFARALDRKYGYVKQLTPYGIKTPVEFYSFLHRGLVLVPSAEDSNAVEIDLEFQDPAIANTLMKRVFVEGNETVRLLDTERAAKFAGYVENRFASETNKSLQDAMLALLMTQERFLMVTQVDLPYAANLIDGPNTSEKPTSPKKLLMTAIGAVFGFSLMIGWLLLADAIVSDRRRRGLPPPKFWAFPPEVFGEK